MDFLDKIDSYILGELPSNELETFQNQLKSDDDLVLKVEKRETILLGLQALGNQKMRQRIKKVRAEMLENKEEVSDSKSAQSKYISMRWIAVAAAIIGLLFITKQVLIPNSIDSGKLFTENFEPYSASFATRNTSSTKEYLQAGRYYSIKEYSSAIPLLKNILSEQSNNSDVELTLANSFLAIGKIEEAIFHCEAVISREDALYIDQAHWYLALSYLKQNKISESKTILQKLASDSKADFHQEAKALLSRI